MKEGWRSQSKETRMWNPVLLNTDFQPESNLASGCCPCNSGHALAGLESAGVKCLNEPALPSLQHSRFFSLSVAQSLLPLFLSSIIKLSLLFWFKSSSELPELKINHSVSGNAEPPGSRKHLFLLSARRGNSAFRIKHENFDCHLTSPPLPTPTSISRNRSLLRLESICLNNLIRKLHSQKLTSAGCQQEQASSICILAQVCSASHTASLYWLSITV